MFRTSSYLAIALSITAIASATTPAAAFSSQFMGGASNHLISQTHPAAAVTTSVQSSLEAHHVLTSVSPPPNKATPGNSKVGSTSYPIQKYPSAGAVLKNAEIPVAQLPPFKPHLPIDNVCPDNPLMCKPTPTPPQPPHPQPNPGPVVIVVPPVQVPVAVPYGLPSRVTSGPSYASATQARPSVASQPIATQCGVAGGIPALAAGIDQLLPTAQLSQDDMTKVTELRQMIQDLSTSGKLDAARNVEEVAMYYLGYQKIWLKCGLGTFAWAQTPGNDAGQSSNQSMAQSTVQSK